MQQQHHQHCEFSRPTPSHHRTNATIVLHSPPTRIIANNDATGTATSPATANEFPQNHRHYHHTHSRERNQPLTIKRKRKRRCQRHTTTTIFLLTPLLRIAPPPAIHPPSLTITTIQLVFNDTESPHHRTRNAFANAYRTIIFIIDHQPPTVGLPSYHRTMIRDNVTFATVNGSTYHQYPSDDKDESNTFADNDHSTSSSRSSTSIEHDESHSYLYHRQQPQQHHHTAINISRRHHHANIPISV